MKTTERFSDRVENYVRHRPDYPPEVFELLRAECGLGPTAVVADIGSGTGIFTEGLLSAGASVYALEPNAPMRQAAEARLGPNPNFHSRPEPAEQTGLADGSIDLVTCAQSFHWFDADMAKREFRRILRPGGSLALVWNERLEEGSPFLAGYESLLRDLCPEYLQVRHRTLDGKDLGRFFRPSTMRQATFANRQLLDRGGLAGRALSSSYAPAPGSTNYEAFVAALNWLFEETQQNGRVDMAYRTEVYFATL